MSVFTGERPFLVNRFVEWMPTALLALCVYLKHCFGACSGISFIDSSSQITPGNTDDRKPGEDLLQGLYGKVFAVRGYVSKALAERLVETCGIEFFAKPKRNMKNHLMRLTDKLLARGAPLSKPSLTSSRTFPRLSIPGIAAPPTSWSMFSVA